MVWPSVRTRRIFTYLSDQNPFKSRPLMKTLLSLRIFAIGCAGLILGGELRAQINNFDSLNGYAAGLELRLSSRHADLTDLRSPRRVGRSTSRVIL